jgi:hypothetical protein
MFYVVSFIQCPNSKITAKFEPVSATGPIAVHPLFLLSWQTVASGNDLLNKMNIIQYHAAL